MNARSTGLMLQAVVTPLATVAFAMLSWKLCLSGGLYCLLPVAWFFGFFILGLAGAHGLFYVCVFPLRDSDELRPAMLRFLQVYWFLQVPLAWFNGVKPAYSILATQGAIVIVATIFAITTREKRKAEQSVAPLRRAPRTGPSEGAH